MRFEKRRTQKVEVCTNCTGFIATNEPAYFGKKAILCVRCHAIRECVESIPESLRHKP